MRNLIEVSQIPFPIMTIQMFRVFLKGFICILNSYFCFYLNVLDTGEFIGAAIDECFRKFTQQACDVSTIISKKEY